MNDKPCTDRPVLLLPLRLETRFLGNDLWVRIYPDQIFVDTHQELLTRAEREAGQRYQALVTKSDDEVEQRSAWRELARRYGPERAAWIAHNTKAETPDELGFGREDGAPMAAPRLLGLPHHFDVFAYRGDELVDQWSGNPIPRDLTLLAAPYQVTYDETRTALPGTLEVQVIDSQSAPMPGVGLSLEGKSPEAVSKGGSRFQFTGLTEAEVVLRLSPKGQGTTLLPVRVGVGPVTIMAQDELFDEKSRWAIDLEQAERQGMAVCIPLEKLGIEHGDDDDDDDDEEMSFRIIVVGMQSTSAQEGQVVLTRLIDSHHYATGLGFLEYGTPTNNTQTTRSGHSATVEDREGSYEIEILGPAGWDVAPDDPRTNAHRLERALGLVEAPQALRYLSHAGDTADAYAKEMQTALWPATGDYVLRHLLPGVVDDLQELGDHFVEYVRGSGPLPAIRVGDQPYGILPVTGVRGWEVSDPASLDDRLHSILHERYETWLRWANDPQRVPRVGQDPDPDRELLQILSMEPTSVSYRVRPFVDEKFVTWMQFTLHDYVFKPGSSYAALDVSPSYWAKVWSEAWQAIRVHAKELWPSLADVPASSPQGASLMGLYGWWDDPDPEGPLQMLPIPLVHDVVDGTSDCPLHYLTHLCRQVDSDSQTLLHDLLNRSLDLTPEGASDVRRAICDLAASRVLEFLNKVMEVEQIEQCLDLPRLIAEAILETRKSLPGGRFTSLDQIERFVGGDDPYGILEAFCEQGPKPDTERLFRETLDLCTHRVDAWITSLATKRLEAMRRERPTGIYLGAYGYVEDLKPPGAPDSAGYVEDLKPRGAPGSAGYIHAPSWGQAVAAAVLHNAYLTHNYNEDQRDDDGGKKPNPFRISLNSERVRRALRILEGVRPGQPLGALLGYQFERALHERQLDEYIDDFRETYPLVAHKKTPQAEGESAEAVAARNVVDGLSLARSWQQSGRDPAEINAIMEGEGAKADVPLVVQEVDHLLQTLDAVSDVLMYEGVYQAVQGNYDRAGAALEAAAGNAASEIESLVTPVSGKLVGHRVCFLFAPPLSEHHPEPDDAGGPRAAAEPRLAAWFGDLLGDLDQIGCHYTYRDAGMVMPSDGTATLKDLGISAIDVLYLSASPSSGEQTEIEQRFVYHVREKHQLESDTSVTLDFARSDSFACGVGEALELSRQVLQILGSAGPLGPGTLCLPAEAGGVGFAPDDVTELSERCESVLQDAEELTKMLDRAIRPKDILYALFRASRYGVVGALPPGPDDPGPLLEAGQVLLIPVPEGARSMQYRVQRGDTLWDIARQFGTTEAKIAEANQIDDPDLIRVGQILDIPLEPEQETVSYVVRPGDTLWDITWIFFGTSLQDLLQVNQIEEPDLETRRTNVLMELQKRVSECRNLYEKAFDTETQVKPDSQIESLVEAMEALFGQDFLVLPTFAPHNDKRYIAYRVQRGDTLQGIALRFGIAWRLLAEINRIRPPYRITVGQILHIPNVERLIEYRVQRGDTLQGIARRFGTTVARLAELNNIPEPYHIRVVQVLFIPNGGEITRAFAQRDLLAGTDDGQHRVRLWLQQTAPVRPSLRELEDILMMTEAWRGAEGAPRADEPPLALCVAQLPFDQDNRWLALDDDERGADYDTARDRGALSIVAAAGAPQTGPGRGRGPDAALAPRLAGFLLDQWDEFIPDDTVHTSVSFQYDGPSSQAPQSLLLAVPGRRDGTSEWDEEALVEIVRDTMDLAKVRAVDLDAMCAISDESSEEQGIGLALPALMLPTDREQPGWAHETATECIEAWFESLLPLHCAGFMEVNEPIDEPIVIGEGVQVYDLGDRARLYFADFGESAPRPRKYLHPGIAESFGIELPSESVQIRLELVWPFVYLIDNYTGEELGELLGVAALNGVNGEGEQIEIGIAYERLQEVRIIPPWGVPLFPVRLFAVSITGSGIRTLRLKPRGNTVLLRRACYRTED